MEPAKIMSLLNSSGFIPAIRYYKYVMDAKTTPCASCLRFAGEIFAENDVNIPSLPQGIEHILVKRMRPGEVEGEGFYDEHAGGLS